MNKNSNKLVVFNENFMFSMIVSLPHPLLHYQGKRIPHRRLHPRLLKPMLKLPFQSFHYFCLGIKKFHHKFVVVDSPQYC